MVLELFCMNDGLDESEMSGIFLLPITGVFSLSSARLPFPPSLRFRPGDRCSGPVTLLAPCLPARRVDRLVANIGLPPPGYPRRLPTYPPPGCPEADRLSPGEGGEAGGGSSGGGGAGARARVLPA